MYLRIDRQNYPMQPTEDGFEPVYLTPCDGCHTDLRVARTVTDQGYPEIECPGCGKRHYVFAVLSAAN